MKEQVNLNLREATLSERVWLWRRRHASTNGRRTGRGGGRLSENEAATLLGLSLEAYQLAERGDPGAAEAAAGAIRERGETLSYPSPSEACALARRRADTEVLPLCQALGGISKPTFYARENQAHPELVAMWQQRGFTF